MKELPTSTSKIKVAFSYPSAGWVLMALLVTNYNQNLVVHCSDVFEPFTDLVNWLHKLADGNLPANFEIDEEGIVKHFVVEQAESQEDTVEFRVEGDRWDQQKQDYEFSHFIRCKLRRSQILGEFTRRLQEWLAHEYDPFKFGNRNERDLEEDYGFDLRQDIDIEKLAAKVNSV
jgi:hypothetical protein